MNYLPVYNNIIDTLKIYKESIYSALFIGSNYKISKSKKCVESDIDVLILLNNMDVYDQMVNSIKTKMLCCDIEVVNFWGVISQNMFSKEIIHLLIDPIWHFEFKQPIFRKTLEQYPVIIGEKCDKYIPSNMSLIEFIDNAPLRMIKKIQSDDWDILDWVYENNEWLLKARKNTYSNNESNYKYACKHSVFNTISFLNYSLDRAEYPRVLNTWREIGGPKKEFVYKILYGKEPIGKEESIDFIQHIIDWLILK